MKSALRLTFLAAFSLAVQGGTFRASHLSNKRDLEDLCADSSASVSCGDVSSADGLVAHRDDCRLFLQCVHADEPAVCRQCPAGLHFNPRLHVCDHPDHAGCKDGEASPEVAGAEPAAADTPQRCIDNSVTAVSCSGAGSDALVAHPDDCGLFYYCASGAPVCRACSAGLHFNSLLHVCDHPDQAGCIVPPATSE